MLLKPDQTTHRWGRSLEDTISQPAERNRLTLFLCSGVQKMRDETGMESRRERKGKREFREH
eukprot:1019125-Rhodomonas_salina.2